MKRRKDDKKKKREREREKRKKAKSSRRISHYRKYIYIYCHSTKIVNYVCLYFIKDFKLVFVDYKSLQ